MSSPPFPQDASLAAAMDGLEIPSTSAAPSTPALEPSTPTAEGTAAAPGKEGKKKGGNRGGATSPALVLGKGTTVLRAAVEAAAGMTAGVQSVGSAAFLEKAWRGCRTVLEPLGQDCGKLLEEIRTVVEANQVRGRGNPDRGRGHKV